jgi:hypothetical protein
VRNNDSFVSCLPILVIEDNSGDVDLVLNDGEIALNLLRSLSAERAPVPRSSYSILTCQSDQAEKQSQSEPSSSHPLHNGPCWSQACTCLLHRS